MHTPHLEIQILKRPHENRMDGQLKLKCNFKIYQQQHNKNTSFYELLKFP